jgi:sec-independent protein translocase protein TatA
MPIGPWELVIIILVLLLVFGSRRLPEMGRSLGKGMREFKSSVTGKDEKQAEQPEELTAQAVEEDEEPVGAASSNERDRDS